MPDGTTADRGAATVAPMDAQPVQQAVDGRDQPSPAGDDARDVPATGGFSLDAFSRHDRLRLFSFTTADHRAEYIWILRAFERSRANYVVLLHAQDVAAILGEFAAEQPEREQIPQLSADELTPLLDQLYGWQLLDRSYDGARAATLGARRDVKFHVLVGDVASESAGGEGGERRAEEGRASGG